MKHIGSRFTNSKEHEIKSKIRITIVMCKCQISIRNKINEEITKGKKKKKKQLS